jgi:hypothetical protein
VPVCEQILPISGFLSALPFDARSASRAGGGRGCDPGRLSFLYFEAGQEDLSPTGGQLDGHMFSVLGDGTGNDDTLAFHGI